MGFWGKYTENKMSGSGELVPDGLPDREAETTTEAAKLATIKEKAFRSREKATPISENEGLPSVNRRKGHNNIVTLCGFIFILGAGAAVMLSLHGDKTPKVKKDSHEDQVSNQMPPLLMPDKIPPLPRDSVPAIQPIASVRPIPLQGTMTPTSNLPPASIDWTERKKGGSLIITESGNSSPSLDAKKVQAAVSPLAETEEDAPLGQSRHSGEDSLSSKLDPVTTKSASASLLSHRHFLITKGTSLDCVLETALDSHVPGLTTCRLTRDVYSDDGKVLLLDRGTQLVGEYQGAVKQGQVRLFVLWSRAKTPHGVVVDLNSPGTDALGRSGLEGWVDTHFAARFGAAILMSFIKDSVTALVNNRSNSGTTNVYGGTYTGGEKIVEKVLESTVNIPPTMVKNQGDSIQVMLARDLDFSRVYRLQVKP